MANNNMVERLNNTVRGRQRPARGLQSPRGPPHGGPSRVLQPRPPARSARWQDARRGRRLTRPEERRLLGRNYKGRLGPLERNDDQPRGRPTMNATEPCSPVGRPHPLPNLFLSPARLGPPMDEPVVGAAFGNVSTTEFRFAVRDATLRRLDYVKVDHPTDGALVAHVTEVTRETNLSFEDATRAGYHDAPARDHLVARAR